MGKIKIFTDEYKVGYAKDVMAQAVQIINTVLTACTGTGLNLTGREDLVLYPNNIVELAKEQYQKAVKKSNPFAKMEHADDDTIPVVKFVSEYAGKLQLRLRRLGSNVIFTYDPRLIEFSGGKCQLISDIDERLTEKFSIYATEEQANLWAEVVCLKQKIDKLNEALCGGTVAIGTESVGPLLSITGSATTLNPRALAYVNFRKV